MHSTLKLALKLSNFWPENKYQCQNIQCAHMILPSKGSHFESLDILSNVTIGQKGLSENNFQKCIQAWQRLWNAHRKSEGKYFLC